MELFRNILKKIRKEIHSVFFFFCVFLCPLSVGYAEIVPDAPLPDDITSLTLEELMECDVVVTTITRREKKLQDTPLAIFVINSEDIRRSGAVNIPELLRMVPGFHVSTVMTLDSQFGALNSTISSRGFHSLFVSKVVLLIDGRPLFSHATTINWGTIDYMLEDIERIEIIRGAASALWGSHAVNGALNIVTKKAEDTKGGLVIAGHETQSSSYGAVRYGGNVSDRTSGRIYVKYTDEMFILEQNNDEVEFYDRLVRSGFRVDQKLSDHHALHYFGELYAGQADSLAKQNVFSQIFDTRDVDTDVISGYVFMNYQYKPSNASEINAKLSFDRLETVNRKLGLENDEDYEINRKYGYVEDTVQLSIDHKLMVKDRFLFVWGASTMMMRDDFDVTTYMSADPISKSTDLHSAFLHADVELVPDTIIWSMGSNIEHNDYTGYEFLPSIQLLWKMNPLHSVWFSIARSERTPLRLESDSYFITEFATDDMGSGPIPIEFEVHGTQERITEKAYSGEVGYRLNISELFNMDLSFYYNKYEDLMAVGDITLFFPVDSESHFSAKSYLTNIVEAKAVGAEIIMNYRPVKWWTLKGAYSYLNFDQNYLDGKKPIFDLYLTFKNSPSHQVSFQSWMDLTEKIEVNTWIRYVSEWEIFEGIATESYVSFDIQIRWKLTKNFDVYFNGKNLNKSHTDFIGKSVYEFRIIDETTFHIKTEWRF